MAATGTANEDGEPIGAANRVIEQVYKVRLALKRLKKRSRLAYYTTSYAMKLTAVGALLYVLL
jgi:aspartyl/asparaginyl beta-hydroxylase (cupin superfamily)